MLPLISKSINKLDSKCELMPNNANQATPRSEANLNHSKSCTRCVHNDNRNYEIKLKDNKERDKDDTPCMMNIKAHDRDDMHK